jgi:hypothetical protein
MYAAVIERVENSLKTLGVEPDQARSDEGQYSISKDSTEIMIDVWEQNNLVFFQVMSQITEVKNEDQAEVYKMLLEENQLLVESSFTIINNAIFVKETIECGVLFTQERVISAITRVAFYSETYTNKWKQ